MEKSTISRCRKCGDDFPGTFGDGGYCHFHRQAALSANWRACQAKIPERYRGCTYDQIVGAEKQVGKMRRWVASDYATHAWVTIQGNSGTGKTHLAAVAAMEFASPFVCPVSWINAGDLASEVLDLSFKGGVTSYLCQFFEPYVLVLDDLGVEGVQESVRLAIYRVLNTRWERRARTIVTTNMTFADIATKHGQQVADRLLRTGSFIKFDQESHYWAKLTGKTLAGSPDQTPRLAQAGDPAQTNRNQENKA